jgi:A/G-specific adenine glycosylase
MAKQQKRVAAKKPPQDFVGILQSHLHDWFLQNKRDLPWRQSRDAYRIWISEVMLQQTTTQAVIPFYQRFLERFPRLESLATADEKEVVKYWAGLGYYSRARNLHKAAQILNTKPFPQTAAELLPLPGFGPYTSRAVSSLAFGEKVGVLDGNVIRILSRVTGKKMKWWESKDRQELQNLSDRLAQSQDSASINQGMMELGATVCTPQSPACFLCPWSQNCVARMKGLVEKLPLKKPKEESVILLWSVDWIVKNNKIAFIENSYAPFLRKSPILPGQIEHLSQRPEKFDLKHSITKYEIFTCIKKTPLSAIHSTKQRQLFWLDIAKITEEIPYSLIKKVVQKMVSTKQGSAPSTSPTN